MKTEIEQGLIAKIKTLSPQQMIEVEDIIDFLATKRKTALDRLLAIAVPVKAEAVFCYNKLMFLNILGTDYANYN